MYKKYSLILLSALTYCIPFIASDYLWWTTPLFPLLFLYIALTEKLSFKEGFVWGSIAWIGLAHGPLLGAFRMSSGWWAYRILPMVFIMLYEGLCAGVWLWLTHMVLKKWGTRNVFAQTSVWVASLTLYLTWVAEYQFIIFDRSEGYLLAHPLILFSYYPPLLALLPYIGLFLMTSLFCATAGACVYALFVRTRTAALLLCLFVAPWFISLLIPAQKTTPPAWLHKIARLPDFYPNVKDMRQVVWAIAHDLNKVLDEHPDAEVIILPESSVYADRLPEQPELFKYWGTEYLGKPVHVLMGGYRWQDNNYRNTLYWIYDGKVQGYFDKRHAMILTERVPSLFNFNFIAQLYYRKFPPIVASDNNRPSMKMCNTELVPYLCSETFFNKCPDDDATSTTILSSCNDTWTPSTYVRKLMYVGARFKAIQWQRDILYTTFLHGAYFDRNGGICELEA